MEPATLREFYAAVTTAEALHLQRLLEFLGMVKLQAKHEERKLTAIRNANEHC